jgi:bleomycin hydrolase
MADSTTVTQDVVQEIDKKFAEDPKNQLAQNVAVRHGLLEIMLSREVMKGRVHQYNTPIPDEGKPVTNQKSSGRCWIFALLNAMRLPFIKKYELPDFEFSQSYLYFWDKIERTNYLTEVFISTRGEPLDGRLMGFLLTEPYNDGGQWDMLVNLVNKYGVVPKPYYPESHTSESTRHLNKILSHKLRQFCLKIRSMKDASDDDIRKEKTAILQQAYRICAIALGTPPKTFSWEYKTKGTNGAYKCHSDLTPKTFYDQFVKPIYDIENKICLINDPRPENCYNKLYTVQYLGNIHEGYPVRYINVTNDELKEYAIKSLKKGEAVWFGSDVGAHHVRKSGLNDLDV